MVICGAYGRGNAGDDAILLAILTELRSIDPDLSCQVFSRSPMDTRRTYRVNAFYTFHFWKALYYFKHAKFFINGGGSLMQDVTSYRSLWVYLWTLAAAKRHGCPVIMYGCLNSRGIPAHGKYIGFILRPWPGFEDRAKDIAAAADYAYERYGLTPVFFPIEPRLDVSAAHRVTGRMTAPYHLLTQAYTAGQTIGILSRMQVAVSMRLHGLIFAASQGVPLVGIVYDQKVSSFLSYIGQDLYDDLKQMTADKLKGLIDQAVTRGKDPALLADSVEKLRRMDQVNRQVLEEYVAQRPHTRQKGDAHP